MKKVIILICAGLISLNAFSQESVSQLYKKWAIDDINKGQYEKALSEFKRADFTYWRDDSDLSLDLSKFDEFSSYAFQQNITDEQKIILYHYTASYAYDYGDYFFSEKQYTEAAQFYGIAAQYYEPIQEVYPLGAMYSNNMLGNAYGIQKKYADAKIAYLKAINVIDTYIKDTIGAKHMVINNLVENSLLAGDTIEAEKYFIINNPIALPVDTTDSYIFMWKLLGQYYNLKGDFKKAALYQLKESELYQLLKNFESLAISSCNVAYDYFLNNDTVLAKLYFDKAYNICKSNDVADATRIYILEGRSMAYGSCGEYVTAEECCLDLLRTGERGKDFSAQQTAKNGLLIAAIGQDDIQKASNCISLGADVNCQMWGVFPLHLGIMQDNLKFRDFSKDVTKDDFSELLLKNGAKVDMIGSDLETAILFEDYRLCFLLLQYGANPNAYNYDGTMTIIQYAEQTGLKRFGNLLKNKKSYSDKLTIQELDMLCKGAVNRHDYETARKLCEQALNQFYEEIDETKYTGFRTRQQILFYYVTTLANLSMVASQQGDIDLVENLLIEAAQWEKERKKYPDAYGIGFDDIDEMIVRAIALRDSTAGFSHGVDILALNEWNYRKNLGVQDKYYWQSMALVSHYFKVNGAKDNAIDGYRQLLRYVVDASNPIDSIGLSNYSNMISDMAYLQKTREDTIILKEEFERAKEYFRVLFGDDSLNYYGNIAPMSWHIVPIEEQLTYINSYLRLLEQSPLKDSADYYDARFVTSMFLSEGIFTHDCLASSRFVSSLTPIIHYLSKTQLSVQQAVSSTWIWANSDLKRYEDIWTVVPTYFRSNQKKIKNQLSIMSSEVGNAWLNNSNTYLTDDYIYHAASASEPPHICLEEIYNNELFKKGLLLRSTANMERYLLETSDSSAIYLYNVVKSLKIQREQLRTESNNDSIIMSINKEIDNKERILYNISSKYQEVVQYDNIDWMNIKNTLSPNQLAIEYMVGRWYGDTTMYFALLLRSDSEYPILIQLFEEKEASSLINTSTENRTSFTYSYSGNGEQLSQLVWSKILPYIKPGETIYFAPSGLLHQLAIEALPYDSTHTMGDIFNLVRLSSTREIVTHTHDTRHSSATLYGGIQYDMDTTAIKTESAKYPDITVKRSLDNDTLNRGKIGFLEWTKTEVENINSMLKMNNLQVQLFTSTNANEESFKALSGKHQNILHIATHGFFWTDSTAHKKDYFSQRMMTLSNDMPSPSFIDPLNRCGLLFAGAQTAWSGHSTELPEGVQDGILTAKEISLLDLRDADLVVLSACETGKGEITGDGVFGLQRAFKQAGAQTIIMSLWPVNDAATQLLMTEFYRNWITNHQSKREAFRNAQNTVRSKYEEPYYWAGFIMLD